MPVRSSQLCGFVLSRIGLLILCVSVPAGCDSDPPRAPISLPPQTTADTGSAIAGATQPAALDPQLVAQFLQGTGWQPPAARPQDYVGSEACATCHADISQRYATHSMAHSLGLVQDVPLLPDQPVAAVITPPGRRTYAVRQSGSQVTHHEILRDERQQEVYDYSAEILYSVGSGARGRSYLLQRGNLLLMSSLTWYSHGKKWDLSPGYQPAGHQGFERQLSDGCLQCHSGRVSSGSAPHTYQSPAFIEPAIGCERCHGPGGGHIKWRESASPTGDDPIVNPAKLEPRLRESVCNQCHLHGVEKIPHYGRSDFDFRPGDDLADIWAVFVNAHPETSGASRAVSQVEQMRESRCFLESRGRLGCTSCHDPHGLPAPTEKTAFYRARCLNCHTNPQSECSVSLQDRTLKIADDSCVACHMPAAAASDVPHTSQTDHRVERRPARQTAEPRTLNQAEFSNSYKLFDDAQDRLSQPVVERAWMLFHSQHSSGSAAAHPGQPNPSVDDLLRLARTSAPDDLPLIQALLSALGNRGRPIEAQALLENSLKNNPGRVDLLENAARFYEWRDQQPLALQYGQRFAEARPNLSENWALLTNLQAAQQNYLSAMESARQGLELNPSSIRLRAMLYRLATTQGDTTEARKQQRVLNLLAPERSP